MAIVQKHGRVDGCEGPHIVAHCVSGPFQRLCGDMRTADVMVRAVGWDFTGFLCSFSMLVSEGVKNAVAPGAAQVLLRNRGASPV